MQETPVQFLGWEDPLEKGWATHSSILGHPEPFSLLPPHTIPLGHPSAPAPGIQYRAQLDEGPETP